MKDYYAVLQISRDAQLVEIKKAYRRLALKYHPDRNPASQAPRKFIEVTEAYEVLRDPDRRRQYDEQYDRHFQAGGVPAQDVNFETAYQEWQAHSHAKAHADARMHYEAFAARLARELRLGMSYIPNLVAMFFTGLGAVAMIATIPDMAEKSGGGVLLLLLVSLGLGILTYKLYTVMRSDYAVDRKHKR